LGVFGTWNLELGFCFGCGTPDCPWDFTVWDFIGVWDLEFAISCPFLSTINSPSINRLRLCLNFPYRLLTHWLSAIRVKSQLSAFTISAFEISPNGDRHTSPRLKRGLPMTLATSCKTQDFGLSGGFRLIPTPFGFCTLPAGTNVAQVFPDSGLYCTVLPGTGGMRISMLHFGH
jgi:hypothetical protein